MLSIALTVMRYFIFSLPFILALFINVEAVPLERRALPGFVNKGLVAFGLIPANAKDSTGDTLGGFGSAVAIKRGTFRKTKKGTFVGSFIVQPDRGHNVHGTIDWQIRQHEIDFVLTPYTGSKPISFLEAKETLKLKYKKTLLYTERQQKKTTGLDALDYRPATGSDPELPIPSSAMDNLSLDAEGLVLNDDGRYVSEVKAPYSMWFNDKLGHQLLDK
ncbi:hypothetical protein FRC02_007779 [Tulasnella sp. 418]|nr:hypothetical protein FRC02_007779 [Tulasnella sp. 418]